MATVIHWLRDMHQLAGKLEQMGRDAYVEAEDLAVQLAEPDVMRARENPTFASSELVSMLARQAKAAARGSAYSFAAAELVAALRKSPIAEEVKAARQPRKADARAAAVASYDAARDFIAKQDEAGEAGHRLALELGAKPDGER